MATTAKANHAHATATCICTAIGCNHIVIRHDGHKSHASTHGNEDSADVAENILNGVGVGSHQSNGRGELVVLLVHALIQPRRVQQSVRVVEPNLSGPWEDACEIQIAANLVHKHG